MSARLSRPDPGPPVRIVHIGLGAFSRAHLAWYTDRCRDAAQWGVSAYTGRSQDLALSLSAQDGLYTLIERGDQADESRVIRSVVRATPGGVLAAFVADIADPATAIVAITITERGYRLGADGFPDLSDPAVAADDRLLRDVLLARSPADSVNPTTALGRLLLGLIARREAGSRALAIMSLDNLPDNGGMLRRVLTGWARSVDSGFAAWLDVNASFPSSSVDRITPRLSDSERTVLQERYRDRAPVVTEPFSDWVIEGSFPAGRPAWETAGARFVDDLAPWEARKLWMLNGAHTLLACLGLLRGHATVADAASDPTCRAAVQALWAEAGAHLPGVLDPAAYAQRLLVRFANPRIEHSLEQIAADSALKLALRVVPVAELERAAGRTAAGCAAALASWIAASGEGLLSTGVAPTDVNAAIRSISTRLADDGDFVGAVTSSIAVISRVPA